MARRVCKRNKEFREKRITDKQTINILLENIFLTRIANKITDKGKKIAVLNLAIISKLSFGIAEKFSDHVLDQSQSEFNQG